MLLSSALKYRVQVTPHRYRLQFVLLLELLLVISVWLWDPNWFPHQIWVQIALTMLLLIHGWQSIINRLQAPVVFSMYQDGRWLYLSDSPDGNRAIQWQMSQHSRFTDWLVWIHLKGLGRSHWFWIFRDEVGDEEYRRICLAVKYCQQNR